MSLLPNFLDKTLAQAEARQATADSPVSARKALLVWIVLMLAASGRRHLCFFGSGRLAAAL
jgi:hypothetical protein